jgi:hypothetical protein
MIGSSMYSTGYVTRLRGLLLPRLLLARSVPRRAWGWPIPVQAALSRCTSFYAREWCSERRCIREQFERQVFIE